MNTNTYLIPDHSETMSLQVVVELDGFQHGQSPFYIKRMAIRSVAFPIQKSVDLVLPPEALPTCPEELPTYQTQTALHGLSPDDPGLYRLAKNAAIRNTVILASRFAQASLGLRIRKETLYVKGRQKMELLSTSLPFLSDFQVQVLNLEEIGCPSLETLGLRDMPVSAPTKVETLTTWPRATKLRNFGALD